MRIQHNIQALNTHRHLAFNNTQTANDTNTAFDRERLQKEIVQMNNEMII